MSRRIAAVAVGLVGAAVLGFLASLLESDERTEQEARAEMIECGRSDR